MILEEMSALHNPWCCLQQPAHPGIGTNASFRMLLAAIDQGWEVVEPVMVVSTTAGTKYFDFILAHFTIGKTHQVRVSATPETEIFIRSSGYGTSNYSYS